MFFFITSKVVDGEYDIALDMGLIVPHFGLGKTSSYTYYSFSIFMELKPKQKSPVENILHSFDIFTWTMLALALACVSMTIYTCYHYENEVNWLYVY